MLKFQRLFRLWVLFTPQSTLSLLILLFRLKDSKNWSFQNGNGRLTKSKPRIAKSLQKIGYERHSNSFSYFGANGLTTRPTVISTPTGVSMSAAMSTAWSVFLATKKTLTKNGTNSTPTYFPTDARSLRCFMYCQLKHFLFLPTFEHGC